MNITAYADNRFQMTRDLTEWAAVYELATARFVGVITRKDDAQEIVYSWDSHAPFLSGTLTFVTATNTLRFFAPSYDIVATVGLAGGTFDFEYGFYLAAAPRDFIRIEGGGATFEPGIVP